jgi:hypothetical protein
MTYSSEITIERIEDQVLADLHEIMTLAFFTG